ncbi:uncharacterized protein LOC144924621 isoform X2 [Branchiostoma floridae x Branchiostoma belcheri]
MATGLDGEIRKLRKKLRQIENLERMDRDLTEEEETKVSKRFEIREKLHELLAQLPRNSAAKVRREESQAVLFTSESCSRSSTTETIQAEVSLEMKRQLEETQNGEVQTESEAGGDGDLEGTAADSTTQPAKAQKVSTPAGAEGETPTVAAGPSSSPTEPAPPAQKTGKTAEKDTPQPKTPEEKKQARLRQMWRGLRFSVSLLKGHEDVVTSVSADGSLLVTGSRDTTVKVWDMKKATEKRSLGGHTGTVTSVILLSPDESRRLSLLYDLFSDWSEKDRLVISGSTDCSIRLWSIGRGCDFRSIYTYSSVQSLCYSEEEGLIISGSDGGKIQVWDSETRSNIQSIRGHNTSVTCLQVEGTHVVSVCEEGVVKVWEIRDQNLHVVYVNESVKCDPPGPLKARPILSLAYANNKIYYGDDGTNIKVLDWKSGTVQKLPNHLRGFGSTDSMVAVEGTLLVSSGYDLDTGIGYLNVRSLPSGEYLASLCDDEAGRLTCVAHTKVTNRHRFVTGGSELLVWDQALPTEREVIAAHYEETFAGPVEHSEDESDEEEDGRDDIETGRRRRRSSAQLAQDASWCTVM